MLVLVGETGDPRHLRVLRELGWGRMYVSRTPRPYPGEPWGFDNGAFRDWLAGREFDGDRFLRRVERAMKAGMPYLAVAPDLVAGGRRSLEFSLEWLPRLPSDWPWYLAVQDGMSLRDVEAVVAPFAGIFLGGTDRFKVTAPHWAALARRCGKRFHYARAGTLRKLMHARACGADSVDSALPIWKSERLLEYARWWAHVTRHEQKRLWPPTVGAPRPEEVQA